jgi:hypothetical protein
MSILEGKRENVIAEGIGDFILKRLADAPHRLTIDMHDRSCPGQKG